MAEKVYQLHTRSQHAKRGRSGFSGPDTYVAVTIAPADVAVPLYLNRSVLEKRGIDIVYCGEGYAKYRKTARSMLNQAIVRAEKYIEKNKEKES